MGNKELNKLLYVFASIFILFLAIFGYIILGWFRVTINDEFVPIFYYYPLLPVLYSALFSIPAIVISRKFGLFWGLSTLLVGAVFYSLLGYYYILHAIDNYHNLVLVLLGSIFLLAVLSVIVTVLPEWIAARKKRPEIISSEPITKAHKKSDIAKVEVVNMPTIPQPIEVVIKYHDQMTGKTYTMNQKSERELLDEERKRESRDTFEEDLKQFIEGDNKDWEEKAEELLRIEEEKERKEKEYVKEGQAPEEAEEIKEEEHIEEGQAPEKEQIEERSGTPKIKIKREDLLFEQPDKKEEEKFEVIDKPSAKDEKEKTSDFDIITSKDRIELYDNLISRLIKEVKPTQAIFILNYNAESNDLVLDEVYGLDRELKGIIIASAEDGFESKAISDKEAKLIYSLDKLILPDNKTSRLYFKEKEIGLKSLLIAPFILNNELKAVITIGNYDDPRAFSQDDVSKVNEILDLAIFSFENIDQIEETEEISFENKKIINLAIEIGSIMEMESMLQSLLTNVIEIVNADTGSIMLLDEVNEELEVRTVEGPNEDLIIKTRVPIGEGIAGWVAKYRKPLIIDDYQSSDQALEEGKPQIFSSISVPIMSGDKLVGVINAGSTKRDTKFLKDDLERATTLTNLASRSIDSVRLISELEGLYLDTIKALTTAIETKDPYSQGHSENVVKYALAIAEEMKLDSKDVKAIETAGWLHDIGMIGMRDNFNKKIGPLNVIEKTILKKHPKIAKDLLEKVSVLRNVIPIIYHHHEHFDGRGYIDGLSGEDIPLGARIMAVADAFDALTSDRAYRKAFPADEAMAELEKSSGTQFDPKVITAFKKIFGNIELSENKKVESI